eukprot:7840099-Pyramimonas_sp.AAC.1
MEANRVTLQAHTLKPYCTETAGLTPSTRGSRSPSGVSPNPGPSTGTQCADSAWHYTDTP